jgi:hypothetical protein
MLAARKEKMALALAWVLERITPRCCFTRNAIIGSMLDLACTIVKVFAKTKHRTMHYKMQPT